MYTVTLLSACGRLDIVLKGKSSSLTMNQLILQKFGIHLKKTLLQIPSTICYEFQYQKGSSSVLFTKIKEHIMTSDIND